MRGFVAKFAAPPLGGKQRIKSFGFQPAEGGGGVRKGGGGRKGKGEEGGGRGEGEKSRVEH